MHNEIDTLLRKQEFLCEEVFKLAEHDPHVEFTLLRFFMGSRLNPWLRSFPLHWGGHFGEKNDSLTLKTVDVGSRVQLLIAETGGKIGVFTYTYG